MKTSEDPRMVAARMERAFFVGTLPVCNLKLKVESRASFIKGGGRKEKEEVICERLRYSSSLYGRATSDLLLSPSRWQLGRKKPECARKSLLPSAFCLSKVLSPHRRSAPSLLWTAFRCSRRRRACRTRAGCLLSSRPGSRIRSRSCRPRHGTSGRRTAGRSPNREWLRGA